jgi:tRNA A37 threonylcarbamoyltransferase TsaD
MGYPRRYFWWGCFIQQYFQTRFTGTVEKKEQKHSIVFCPPELSKDNAVGTALLGLQAFNKRILKGRNECLK